MKTKVAMVISFAGVLVAGSAAALVNTQVLGSTSSNANAPLVVDDLQQVQQTVPTVTVPTLDTTPAVTASPTVPAVTQPTLAASATQAVYAVGAAGTVTLDTTGDRLAIISVIPADGWIVTKSETEDATNVEVKLQVGATEVEFHANLLFGVVTTSVESKDGSVPDNSIVDSGSGRHGGDDGSDDHGGDDD